jgi:hypothetical protein
MARGQIFQNKPSACTHFKKVFCYVAKEGHRLAFAKHLLLGITLHGKNFPKKFDFPLEFSSANAEKVLIEGINFGCQQLKQLDSN